MLLEIYDSFDLRIIAEKKNKTKGSIKDYVFCLSATPSNLESPPLPHHFIIRIYYCLGKNKNYKKKIARKS